MAAAVRRKPEPEYLVTIQTACPAAKIMDKWTTGPVDLRTVRVHVWQKAGGEYVHWNALASNENGPINYTTECVHFA